MTSGPDHPLAPVRVELTVELARAFGVLSAPEVTVARPSRPATPSWSWSTIPATSPPSGWPVIRGIRARPRQYGLGTPDNPVFAGMHEASALVAGATLAAARAMWSGAAEHGASIAGGLHHAMRASASGFCVYNDPAIAIAWLLAEGAERIAYVDIDVHHGDGVQAAFYDDPRVLTISLHETPALLFPGTGLPSETGGAGAVGSAVNVALPGGTGDPGWLRAFHAVVPPLLRAFRPQILVSQHGCDTHRLDPLAHLELTIDGQRAAHAAIHQLAHETAGGRWLLTGGGGYELVQVVPRTWTHLLAEAAGQPVDPQAPTPDPWRDYVRRRTGQHAPDADDRGRPGDLPPVRVRLRPGRPGRPRHHRHPQRGLPRPRPGPALAPAAASACASAGLSPLGATQSPRSTVIVGHPRRCFRGHTGCCYGSCGRAGPWRGWL